MYLWESDKKADGGERRNAMKLTADKIVKQNA